MPGADWKNNILVPVDSRHWTADAFGIFKYSSGLNIQHSTLNFQRPTFNVKLKMEKVLCLRRER